MLLKEGTLPVHWWTHAPNFGDLLAPWLARKISGREVSYVPKGEPGYLVIGSIISHATAESVVWGAGSFGTEPRTHLAPKANYLAVRGPLTRNKLVTHGIDCPRVYGDPALLVPDHYRPDVEQTHEVGVVFRWSEKRWLSRFDVPGVKPIFLGSEDIEQTIDEMLSCRRLVSSSLHGLVLADAYGIPNAWLDSGSPRGLEFKYWDYLISVDKVRQPVTGFNPLRPGLSLGDFLDAFPFDGRMIGLDLQPLRDACPFAGGRA